MVETWAQRLVDCVECGLVNLGITSHLSIIEYFSSCERYHMGNVCSDFHWEQNS